MVGKLKLEGSHAEVYVCVAVGNISMAKSKFVDVGELVIVKSVGVIEPNY